MRLRVCSVICCLLVLVGGGFSAVPVAYASAIQSANQPRILSARVKGKKLILTGENFAPGSVILVDGEPQKTKSDEESPSTSLVAKKAGKFIPDDTAVNIQVLSNNSLTEKFPFFKGQVITIESAGQPITLRTGERFLLFLLKDAYEFTPVVLDETILKKVTDVEIPGSQGVYEALRPGTTKLSATGDLPCAKSKPACLAPSILVEFTVIVE